MPRHPWLRHPARTIRPTPTRCPATGETPFATASLAHAAVTAAGYCLHTDLIAAACDTCGGWHLTRQENPR